MASDNIIDIEIESDRGGVQMIRVRSPRYYIARSRLRIGNNIESIFRYYGRGDIEIVSDRINMRYPEQGIDFEIYCERSQSELFYYIFFTTKLTKNI